MIGTSALAGNWPSQGEKTKAIPLLLLKKKAYDFSNPIVLVKVFPETELNFWVYSCSSERIGYVLRLSSLLVLLNAPDLTEAANLICLLSEERRLTFILI